MPSYDEEDIQAAISAYKRGDYASISYTSRAFRIPRSTLRGRLQNSKLSLGSHENQQIRTLTEEETLEN
jgi:hypothetical protein